MDTSWRASEFEMTRCLKFTQKVSSHKHCKQIQDKYLYRDIFGDFQPMCDMAKSVSRVVDQVSKASLSRIWLILVLHQVQMNICVMSLLWNKWALSRFPSINKLFGFQSIQARFSSPSLKKRRKSEYSNQETSRGNTKLRCHKGCLNGSFWSRNFSWLQSCCDAAFLDVAF